MAKKVYEESKIAAIGAKIREKTGGETTYKTSQMPSGIDEVYEVGKKSMIDESKLLPTTITGNGFVYLNDLSEIPHEVTVQAAEGTKVTVVRNNLFDIDNFSTTTISSAPARKWWERLDNGVRISATDGGWIFLVHFLPTDIEKYKGVEMVISAIISSNNSEQIGRINPSVADDNGNTIKKLFELMGEGEVSREFVIPSDTTGTKMTFTFYASCGSVLHVSGTNRISYTNVYMARKEDIFQYTVGANGIIDGIKSADNLTIIADGLVSVTYNKSYGKHKALSDFWEQYTTRPNGTPRSDWRYAFWGTGWDSRTFRPTKDILMMGSASRCFTAWDWNDMELIDLSAHLKRLGVRLDTSQCTAVDYMFFYNVLIGKIPTIDVTSCTTETNMRNIFSNATILKEIEKIIVNENTYYTLWFEKCTSLEEVRFEGVIGRDIDLHWSIKLSRGSIENIITHLSDTATAATLTLSQTAVNNAFTTDEWNMLVATKPNWTINLI